MKCQCQTAPITTRTSVSDSNQIQTASNAFSESSVVPSHPVVTLTMSDRTEWRKEAREMIEDGKADPYHNSSAAEWAKRTIELMDELEDMRQLANYFKQHLESR